MAEELDSGSAVTDEAVAADIACVARSMNLTALSRAEYLRHGKFSGYHLYDGGRS